MISEMMKKLRDDEEDVYSFMAAMADADDEMIADCEPLAAACEMWSWYACVTDSGAYDYYSGCSDMMLMKRTADFLKEYGCEQFSKAYLRGAEVLMPLIRSGSGVDNDEIKVFSEKLADYLDEYGYEMEEAVREALLDNYEAIAVLDGADAAEEDEDEERDIFDLLSCIDKDDNK